MHRPPRILVSNDDGYSSEGIQVLADALEAIATVWVVAPNREQSAVSHALTLDRPLRMERLATQRYAVDGTPTDCIALGIAKVMADDPPDLVVSGINFGGNMGADVHYSGTVSAAFEGVILGVPAIAISQQVGEGFSYVMAARCAQRLVRWVLANGLPKDTLLNVNVPVGTPKGVKLVRLGSRRYTEGVIEQRDPRKRQIFWIGGGKPVWEARRGTDFYELDQGYITVTPLHLDMTDHGYLEWLASHGTEWMGEWGGES